MIMFQKRFVSKILSGVKRTTIRTRARCGVADDLSLRFWEDKPYRSKHVIIREPVTCLMVIPVRITVHGVALIRGLTLTGIDSEERGMEMLTCFAIREGFDSWTDLVEWFQSAHGLPYEGELIHW